MYSSTRVVITSRRKKVKENVVFVLHGYIFSRVKALVREP